MRKEGGQGSDPSESTTGRKEEGEGEYYKVSTTVGCVTIVNQYALLGYLPFFGAPVQAHFSEKICL